MPSFSESQILAEKYRLVRKLGQGGMGSVWYADHLALNSPIAIKLIDPEIAAHPEALSRFMREAQAAAALRSPHVVQIFDHGIAEGVPYIAMELLEGESLAARLHRVGRLSPREAALVLTHVARAVGRAHEAGITHRDLKPDNVFLVQNDEEVVAKVLDFGIAKASLTGPGAPNPSATQTGAVLGTPYYMSPEQATGAKDLDHRTDIWALGVIAFECLVGRRPFIGETMATIFLSICAAPLPVPSAIAPDVPAGFDEWFMRACSRDVSTRFSTAKEAANEFRRVSGGELTTGRNFNWSDRGDALALRSSSPSYGGTDGHSAPSIPSAIATIHTEGAPKRRTVAVALALALMGIGGLGAYALLRTPADEHSAAQPAAGTPAVLVAAPSAAPPATATTQPSPPAVEPAPTFQPEPPVLAVRVADPAPRDPSPITANTGKPRSRTAPPPPAPKTPPVPTSAPVPPPGGKPKVNLGI